MSQSNGTAQSTSNRLHDLQQRIRELRTVRNALWPDRDDARVLSELTPVMSRLAKLEEELQQHERHELR